MKPFPFAFDVMPLKPLTTHGINNPINALIDALGATTAVMIFGTTNLSVCALSVKSMVTLYLFVAGHTPFVTLMGVATSTPTIITIIVQLVPVAFMLQLRTLTRG
jgi:hypothetical protein